MGDIIARLNSTEGNPTPYILIGIAVWCLIWFAFLRRWLNRPGAGKISSFLADLGFYGCLLSAVFFGFMLIFVIATIRRLSAMACRQCSAPQSSGELLFLLSSLRQNINNPHKTKGRPFGRPANNSSIHFPLLVLPKAPAQSGEYPPSALVFPAAQVQDIHRIYWKWL